MAAHCAECGSLSEPDFYEARFFSLKPARAGTVPARAPPGCTCCSRPPSGCCPLCLTAGHGRLQPRQPAGAAPRLFCVPFTAVASKGCNKSLYSPAACGQAALSTASPPTPALPHPAAAAPARCCARRGCAAAPPAWQTCACGSSERGEWGGLTSGMQVPVRSRSVPCMPACTTAAKPWPRACTPHRERIRFLDDLERDGWELAEAVGGLAAGGWMRRAVDGGGNMMSTALPDPPVCTSPVESTPRATAPPIHPTNQHGRWTTSLPACTTSSPSRTRSGSWLRPGR